MTSQVTDVYQSVVDTLMAIPELNGTIIGVFDDEELLSRLKAVPRLGVGVIYDGILPEQKSGSHRTGMAAAVGVTIVLVLKEFKFAQGLDYRTPGLEYLDKIRQSLMDTRSPTGHYWRFVMEAPAVQKADVIVWVQRWSTPIVLSKENSGS